MRRSILAAAAATTLAVMAVAGAASAQTVIRPGQTINGQLTTSDSKLDDGSYFDCYNLQTQAGQRFQIDQTSSRFDSYLSVVGGGCANATGVLATDDDGGGGLNSRITLDSDGSLWGVVVNSVESDATGAYTLSISGPAGSAPSRPVGKPPAGGGSTPPANNNNNSGGSGQFANLTRPTDPQERYTWDTMCSGVDTVALIQSSEGMSDEALMAWVNESARLHEAAVASARAIGKTEEDVNNDAATFGAAYFQDDSLMTDVPPVPLRNACLSLLG